MSALARSRVVTALIVAMLTPLCARAVPLEIVYGDAPGEGFFDPDRGAARRAAFEFAAAAWADRLGGNVPVGIDATMDPIGGTGSSATLASAGPVTLHRNFSGAEADTWYSAALANQFVGVDVNGPEVPEISVTFNSDLDGPEVLGSVAWYYGLDRAAGVDIDFVSIALHELGHGLGFFETVDAATGEFRMDDQPGIFDRLLHRPGVGALAAMRPTERLAAIVSGALFWNGPSVVQFNGSPAPVYAPEPFRQGASLGHWDTSAHPDELLEPFYTVPVHAPGLTFPALLDMGWPAQAATPTPRASPATATPTYPPRPTATPELTPMARAERAYVSNFDDDTLTIVDLSTFAIIDTIAVGARPIGVAASPDGTCVYVANFGAGSVSVVDTGSNTVIDTIAVGVSANAVAVTPDGALLAVADTAGEETVIVATSTASVLARVFSGAQPSSVALSPDGRLAFVPNFSTKTVAVIDLDVRLRRAIIPLDRNLDGMVGVAISPVTSLGYVTAFYSGGVTGLNAGLLSPRGTFYLSVTDHRPEAVAIDRAGTVTYVSSHHRDTGAGLVTAFDTATQEPTRLYAVGRVPEALALSADERLLLAANTGSDSISVIDTVLRRVVRTFEVGTAPMGVAIAGVPNGPLPATPTATASATLVTATSTATVTASRTPTPTRTRRPPTPTRTSSPTSSPVGPTATELPTATPTAPAASCTGDCDGDKLVRVDELVRAVRIALEQSPLVMCLAADDDASGAVTVDELTRAVNRALTGCP